MSRPRAWRRLGQEFFERDARALAPALLGTILASGSGPRFCAGRIVECEAYLSEGDPASHSFRGRTPRNAAMFARAGTAYVYAIYGMHLCFNVVSGARGVGEAVLVRALEPLIGLEWMRARRTVERERDLCRGPARLVEALAIERAHDGSSLLRGPLSLWSDGTRIAPRDIATAPRIGITRAAERELRFALRGSPWLSRPVR